MVITRATGSQAPNVTGITEGGREIGEGARRRGGSGGRGKKRGKKKVNN